MIIDKYKKITIFPLAMFYLDNIMYSNFGFYSNYIFFSDQHSLTALQQLQDVSPRVKAKGRDEVQGLLATFIWHRISYISSEVDVGANHCIADTFSSTLQKLNVSCMWHSRSRSPHRFNCSFVKYWSHHLQENLCDYEQSSRLIAFICGSWLTSSKSNSMVLNFPIGDLYESMS